jgi:kynurenine 3-monooxygenase
MPTEASLEDKGTQRDRSNVLIVGGGPAGLATALMLAKRGWTDITVLEKRPAADYYEANKSYNYLIDGRGQKFTDLLGLTERLAQIGVSSKEFYLTQIKLDGKRKILKLPTVNPDRKTAYWVPRKAFVQLLYKEIAQNWTDRINILFDTKCDRVDKEGDTLTIVASEENGKIFQFTPHFLVGCDGINSLVRNTLKTWDRSTSNRFEMQLYPSPSSGLRYKVLSLPPQFPLDDTGVERTESTMSYGIRGRSLSLGLLPIKDHNEPRTANIITRPHHPIWELKSGEEAHEYFKNAFPQLPIDLILSPQESDRFVKSEGGSFPAPQYCSGLYFLLAEANAGIVLLGDAVHCFPPDIGQGVNSALEDVCVLNEILSQNNDDLSRALPLYEKMRSPDVKALIHLAQTAFPWQYNQERLGKFLWSINFFVRLVFNRLLPFLFSPPSFFLIQDRKLSYQEIDRKARRTTQLIYIFGIAIAVIFVAFLLKETNSRLN